MKINVVTMRLYSFLFHLRDKALTWFQLLRAIRIETWSQTRHKFMAKYFLPGKTMQLKRRILHNLFQLDQEPLHYEARETKKG